MIEERVKSILSGNDSPDLHFDLLDQPLPRLRARLRLLLRPADAQLPRTSRRGSTSRPGSSPRSTPPSGCARRFAPPRLRAERDQHRLGHRRLPAGRAQARHHPLGDRGDGRMRASVLAGHQVVGHRARPRPGRADGGARPGGGLRLGHLARPAARPHPRAACGGAAPPAEDRSRRWPGPACRWA